MGAWSESSSVLFRHWHLSPLDVGLSSLRMMPATRCLLLMLAVFSCSCSSLKKYAKARPSETTEFLTHGKDLRATNPMESPFVKVWRNPSTAVWEKARTLPTLHVTPVCMDHLRPMQRVLAKVESGGEASRNKAASKLAAYLRSEFERAFRHSPKPLHEVVETPAADSLLVELALVELDPNPITGGVTRRVINLLAFPGAESLVADPLKGRIAIEGRLYDPVQKQVLLEFQDAEQNRSALILSLHDYNRYSHARKVIREWAEQFEQLVREPPDAKIRDSSAFMISIW